MEVIPEIESRTFYTKYKPLKLIKKGKYGQVIKIQENGDDGPIFALKRIKGQNIEKDSKKIIREQQIIKNLDHPNIIKSYDLFMSSDRNGTYYYLLLEYVDAPDLSFFMYSQNILAMEKYDSIAKQMIYVLEYLFKHGVVHRDIKLENVLYDVESDIVKLIDFGFSGLIVNINQSYLNSEIEKVHGTPLYLAPEVVKKEIMSGFDLIKADIWSLGVMLYRLIYRLCPYQPNTREKLVSIMKSNKLKINYPENELISSNYLKILESCLQLDPLKRGNIETLKEILKNFDILAL